MDDVRYAYSCGCTSFLREARCPGCGRGMRVERHADHDPSYICRPVGFGLCEIAPLSARSGSRDAPEVPSGEANRTLSLVNTLRDQLIGN